MVTSTVLTASANQLALGTLRRVNRKAVCLPVTYWKGLAGQRLLTLARWQIRSDGWGVRLPVEMHGLREGRPQDVKRMLNKIGITFSIDLGNAKYVKNPVLSPNAGQKSRIDKRSWRQRRK
jgi:hypothetical protein